MSPGIFTVEPIAWLLRGGLFLAGALVAGLVLRRRSATWVAFYWRSAMLAALVLAGITVAGWEAPWVWTYAPVAPAPAKLPNDDFTESPTVFEADSPMLLLRVEDLAAPGSETRPVPWQMVAWSVWGSGAFVVLVRWIRSLLRRRRLAQGATAIEPDDVWFALLRDVALEGRLPRLLRHPTITVPCAWGLRHPTILIPAVADQWPLEHRQLALAHEWAHLQRGDPFWQTLSVLVLAVHWANPLAWLAVRRWRLAEEQAADDAALLHAEPSSYATLLVACARSTPPQSQPATTMNSHFSMAHPSTVPQRVERVLNPSQDRRRPGFLRCSAFALALGCLGLGCLTLTPGLAAPADDIPEKAGGKAAESKATPQGGEASVPASRSQDSSREIQDKLGFVIPRLVFEQAAIEDAVDFLRKKSKELDTATTDPAQKGVSFILRLSADGASPRPISLDLTNVSLYAATKAVAEAAGLAWRIAPNAVLIHAGDGDSILYTKVFRVHRGFLDPIQTPAGGVFFRPSAVDVLTQAGITFPEKATASYDRRTGFLTVHNTAPNLELAAQYCETLLNRVTKLINVRVELYRLPKSRALKVLDDLDGLDAAADATTTVAKLRQEAQDTGDVSLVSTTSLQTRSGQRARVRSGRGGSEDASQPARLPELGAQPLPKDFQGTILEAEPTLGADGYTVDVTVALTHASPGAKADTSPVIGTLSTSTTITAGQMRLLGTLAGGEGEDQTTLVFLKVGTVSDP